MLKAFSANAAAALLASAIGAGLSAPAMASPEPTTRLVGCGSASCLLVSGRRQSAAQAVLINGHAVAAMGERKWQVRLPVSTVRTWSAPFARTIAVAVGGAGETPSEVDLPIGLLGHSENLAMLTISMK